MDRSDEDLIESHREGGAGALDELLGRWSQRARSLSYRLLGNDEEACDVSQVALLRAASALPSYDGRARFGTWFTRIVINVCRDRLRSVVSAEKARGGWAASSSLANPPALDPTLQSVRRETAHLVSEAVRRLPMKEREVVVLRHYHDLTFGEIAQVTGEPETTIKSRMARGLRRIHVALAPRLGEKS